MNPDDAIHTELHSLQAAGLERTLLSCGRPGGLTVCGGRELVNFSSNDYLDLARHPDVTEAARDAVDRYGAGSGAARLVSGTLPVHEQLEAALASHSGYPSALLFGSGYMANAGLVPALVGRGDAVFADRLAHASLVDAVTLSRAALRRFRHNDPGHLHDLLARHRAGRRLIVTESVFSMDGDLAPLEALAVVAEQHDALLLVDEAHATGVFGPAGGGRIREEERTAGIPLAMGTLSKALGSYGGFVACSMTMRRWLIHRARSFIYTTAPAPACAGAALGALQWLTRNPGAGSELRRRAEVFRGLLREAGLNTLQSASQIIPVVIGENERTLHIAGKLRDRGLLAVAMRPPTVPAGTARLRLSVTLAHTETLLREAAATLIAVFREEGLA